MNRRTREAIRYLGYGMHAIDDQVLAMIEEAFAELDQLAGEKVIYRFFPLIFQPDGGILIGHMRIESSSLKQNLKGCRQVILFAATLGSEADRLIRKYTCVDMSKAVVLQACAAAKLESFCDQCQQKLGEELREQGLCLRPRFSPGYGDFAIRHQPELLRMTEAAKQIGLTMTEGYMLAPSKSVTAVIGVADQAAGGMDAGCMEQGCESCDKVDCKYRRR